MILTAGMLIFLLLISKSASGRGNVKHVKHVKFSGTYSGLAQVSPQKFNLTCLTFPRPEADFEFQNKN